MPYVCNEQRKSNVRHCIHYKQWGAMVKPKRMHTEATTCAQCHKNQPCELAKASLTKPADLPQCGMPVQLSKTISVRCEREQAQREAP